MKVWGAIAAGLVKRGGAVLISIRDARGSSPRDAGTRMVVFGDGTFTGTIGGGTLEWRAIAEAQRLLGQRARISQTGPSELIAVHMSRSYALGPELGQCCGGRVTLSYETIDPGALEAIRAFAASEAEGQLFLAAHIAGGQNRRRIVSAPAEAAASETIETYGDPVRTLLLFGAGHVGRALILALAPLPFRVIWVDGRPDAFPAAVPGNVTLVRPADPVATIADAPEASFALIMTHSHELDLALCDAALRSDRFAHVGVIGSATKRARFEARLRAGGVPATRIAHLVCPIGATGPKSKLPQVIAAATAVELLVKDEQCLKVGHAQNAGDAADMAGNAAMNIGLGRRGQSGDK